MVRKNPEDKKLAVGFAEALLEMFAYLRFSPAERRSFLNASWELWSTDPNPKRFVEKLERFFDELQDQRKSTFQIDRYILNHLRA